MLKAPRILVSSIILVLLFCISSAYAQERLVFAVTLIRHCDRTPVTAVGAPPHHWELGLGELTPLGMNEQYLLGKSLRQRFVDQYQLLPTRYRPGDVYVHATDVNRTILSAQSLLIGLYPPGTGPDLADGKPALPGALQPIPIQTFPESQDPIINGFGAHLQEFMELQKTLVFTDEAWKKLTSSGSGSFGRWSRIFGRKIDNLVDLMPVGDDLNVRMVHGVKLPEGITKSQAEEILGIYSQAMALAFKPRAIGRLLAKDFMTEVLTDLQKAVDGAPPYKFMLYSGHDTTILPVMSALGVPLETEPGYASNLSFELLKDGKDFSVRVRYNGKDVILPDNGGKNTCTFENFKQRVQTL